MSSYTIRPQAERDLDDCAAYIARDNTAVALKFYDKAEKTYEMLAEFPAMGELYHSADARLVGVHYFPIKEYKKYFVFYRQTDVGIEVIRVLRACRQFKLAPVAPEKAPIKARRV